MRGKLIFNYKMSKQYNQWVHTYCPLPWDNKFYYISYQFNCSTDAPPFVTKNHNLHQSCLISNNFFYSSWGPICTKYFKFLISWAFGWYESMGLRPCLPLQIHGDLSSRQKIHDRPVTLSCYIGNNSLFAGIITKHSCTSFLTWIGGR